MTERFAEDSPRETSRLAGLLYMIVVVTGIFALTVRSAAIVPGDGVATATNILTSQSLYRLSVASDLIASACYIGVTAFLYILFRPVSRSVSLLAAVLGLAGCIIGAAMAVNLLASLVVLGGGAYLTAFSPDQLQALSMLFTRLHAQGSIISFIFFGCYCLCLGYLVRRSAFLPRILGVLLTIAGLAWLTSSFTALLVPTFANSISLYLTAIGGLSEIVFALWILVRGVDVFPGKSSAIRAHRSAA